MSVSRSSLEQKKGSAGNVRSAKTRTSAAVTVKASKNELEEEYQKIIEELTSQVAELNGSLEQVTKEREFYFNKLREIEIYVQSAMDESEGSNDSSLKAVQEILYKTEDGFEIPETEDMAPSVPMTAAH